MTPLTQPEPDSSVLKDQQFMDLVALINSVLDQRVVIYVLVDDSKEGLQEANQVRLPKSPANVTTPTADDPAHYLVVAGLGWKVRIDPLEFEHAKYSSTFSVAGDFIRMVDHYLVGEVYQRVATRWYTIVRI